MTDIYPGAWSTVINYISNPLVEDSDDEKKINKAENKALKKKKKRKAERKKSRNNFCTNVIGYAPFRFFFPGNYFVNQRHSIFEFPEFCDRDSPSNVSIVENHTIEGKIAQKSNPASNMEREADLVKDKIST